MRRRSAVVSTGVSDAVGSSKMTIRCGDRQRAGDLRQLALRDREPRDGFGHRGIDAEDPHRLDRPSVHLVVVEGQPPPHFAAEKHVLGDRQVRRQHDLLVHQHDSAPLRVDRPFQFDRRAVELDARRGVGCEMAAEDFHQASICRRRFRR